MDGPSLEAQRRMLQGINPVNREWLKSYFKDSNCKRPETRAVLSIP